LWDTHDEDALIHVISAEFMCRSSPMDDVMTIVKPARKEVIETAIVAVRMKSSS